MPLLRIPSFIPHIIAILQSVATMIGEDAQTDKGAYRWAPWIEQECVWAYLRSNSGLGAARFGIAVPKT